MTLKLHQIFHDIPEPIPNWPLETSVDKFAKLLSDLMLECNITNENAMYRARPAMYKVVDKHLKDKFPAIWKEQALISSVESTHSQSFFQNRPSSISDRYSHFRESSREVEGGCHCSSEQGRLEETQEDQGQALVARSEETERRTDRTRTWKSMKRNRPWYQ